MSFENASTSGRLLSVAAIGLVLDGCASLKVGSDFERSASFSDSDGGGGSP